MGLTYLGPVDGHNMRQMMRLFNEAKRVKGPVVVHVLTEKGRGYEPARQNPDMFHGIGPFDIKTGKPTQKKVCPGYTDVFADALCQVAGGCNHSSYGGRYRAEAVPGGISGALF